MKKFRNSKAEQKVNNSKSTPPTRVSQIWQPLLTSLSIEPLGEKIRGGSREWEENSVAKTTPGGWWK